MGRLLKREFESDGYRVKTTGEDDSGLFSGRTLQRANFNFLRDADVIIIALPIPVLKQGVTAIFGTPRLSGLRHKLIIDICSTKKEPISILSQIRGPSLIGAHPMFGPAVNDLRGQNVFLCPMIAPNAHPVMHERLDRWLDWFRSFWKRRGVNLYDSTPEEHDAFVPAIQFLPLLIALLHSLTLQKAGTDFSKSSEIFTPNSRLLNALAGRMMRPEVAALYANLVNENQHNLQMLDNFAEALSEVATILRSRNREQIEALLAQTASRIPESVRSRNFEFSNRIQRGLSAT